MTFDPVLPWAVLVPVLAALAAVCVWAGITSRGRRLSWTRRLLLVLALAAVAIGPGSGSASAQARRSNLDVLVVVDTSPSVNASDWDGKQPRLLGVRADITRLVGQLDGARFALVTFDSTARQVLPFSSDSSSLVGAIDVTEPEDDTSSAGSSLDRPIKLMQSILAADAKSQPTRQRMVVLISDGEQTSGGGPVASFAPLRSLETGGVVLGYGTTKGATMRAYEPTDPTLNRLIDGPDGQPAVSKYDPATLTAAAQQLGVPFEHRTAPGGGLSPKLPPARAAVGEMHDTAQVVRPYYWVPAIALGALALWEAGVWLASTRRRVR